jgi:hypothetical protein
LRRTAEGASLFSKNQTELLIWYDAMDNATALAALAPSRRAATPSLLPRLL